MFPKFSEWENLFLAEVFFFAIISKLLSILGLSGGAYSEIIYCA